VDESSSVLRPDLEVAHPDSTAFAQKNSRQHQGSTFQARPSFNDFCSSVLAGKAGVPNTRSAMLFGILKYLAYYSFCSPLFKVPGQQVNKFLLIESKALYSYCVIFLLTFATL